MAKTLPMLDLLSTEAGHLEEAGLLRKEPALETPQGPSVRIGGRELLSFASGDYLGLANHTALKKAAKAAIDDFGVGLASSRMIGGTIELHLELEKAMTELLGTEDTLVFASGWQANTGLFESLLGERDFVFVDEQCQPSLADGIRLSRARVFSYRANDVEHLEDRLRRSRGARFRAIATDGICPLDGRPAKLDAITGSFGVALGGGAGGFVSGRKSLIEWLRQKSRPHLASAALAPPCTAAALEAARIARKDDELRQSLDTNVKLFRGALKSAGLELLDAEHPAVAILVGDAVAAQRVTDALHKKGLFVTGFCHPVVPEGAARIRAQISARHTQKSLKEAAAAIAEAVTTVRDRTAPPAARA